jgi:hypothetical protein
MDSWLHLIRKKPAKIIKGWEILRDIGSFKVSKGHIDQGSPGLWVSPKENDDGDYCLPLPLSSYLCVS